MSEPIPEAIPTSADPRSRRPVKKARRLPPSASAKESQADAIDTLFLDPERAANLPEASKTKMSASLPAPPEIVANVQGSSAGAGSGEFHVYKASRRREYERMRLMDEEAKKEEEDDKWEREERERREKDDAKTRKNREKRNRRKKGKPGGTDQSVNVEPEANGKNNTDKKQVKEPLEVKVPTRLEEDAFSTAVAGGDAVAGGQESGITIHDDD
ncbi:hypothetical protein DV736_g5910, partial [Chaetothyriales sp. CBS 134916]